MRKIISVKTFSYCNISTDRSKNKGFLLLELACALVVLLLFIVGIAGILAQAARLSHRTRALMEATHYAAQAYERALHTGISASYQRDGYTIVQDSYVLRGQRRGYVHISWVCHGEKQAITLGRAPK